MEVSSSAHGSLRGFFFFVSSLDQESLVICTIPLESKRFVTLTQFSNFSYIYIFVVLFRLGFPFFLSRSIDKTMSQ